jgi:hypothetical protein
VILRPKAVNPGDRSRIEFEPAAKNVNFTVHKFSDKPRPAPEDTVVVSCFSEFGCEMLGPMYCLPAVREEFPGKYLVAAGWYGREYLYRHAADEFWELGEEHQYLRDACRAFHFESKNLERIEKHLSQYGTLFSAARMGNLAVGHKCWSCRSEWKSLENPDRCPQCNGTSLRKSLFSDVWETKKRAVPIPPPSPEKMEEARKYLGPNPVGVFARNRVTYGRNLPPEFYTKLVGLLEQEGYTPVWLGEKHNTLACPVPHVIDFSRMKESRDLELTMAIVKQVQFTLQFWTASTRLAGVVGTPFVVFESPDQIVGQGQEGMRLAITTFGESKLVYSHYLNVNEDHDGAMSVLGQVIRQVKEGDWRDVVGMVDQPAVVQGMVLNSGVRRRRAS